MNKNNCDKCLNLGDGIHINEVLGRGETNWLEKGGVAGREVRAMLTRTLVLTLKKMQTASKPKGKGIWTTESTSIKVIKFLMDFLS